jgi:hypothetical protein
MSRDVRCRYLPLAVKLPFFATEAMTAKDAGE